MTVADNTSRNQYTATSGQTVFAYTFEIVDKDDIVVLKNGTTLSEGTDYAVSGVGTDTWWQYNPYRWCDYRRRTDPVQGHALLSHPELYKLW